jgi:predicted nucleic-acid-binding protein
MIGLDTNIVIRYLTQDDASQATEATVLIEGTLSPDNPGYLTLITLIEITWVLESCYSQSRAEILNVLNSLLTTKQLVIERADTAYLALKRCQEHPKSDFSDALIAILSEQVGCSTVFTFDKNAKSVGMTLLR